MTATLDPIVKPDLGNRRGVGVWAFLLALCTAGALAHVAVRMHGIQIAYASGASGAPTPSWRSSGGA